MNILINMLINLRNYMSASFINLAMVLIITAAVTYIIILMYKICNPGFAVAVITFLSVICIATTGIISGVSLLGSAVHQTNMQMQAAAKQQIIEVSGGEENLENMNKMMATTGLKPSDILHGTKMADRATEMINNWTDQAESLSSGGGK